MKVEPGREANRSYQDGMAALLDSAEAKRESMELEDGADVASRIRTAALEAMVKQMDQLFKQFQSQQQPPTAAASSGTHRGAQDVQDNLVVLGGFKKETPRGIIEEAWAKTLMPRSPRQLRGLLPRHALLCLVCALSRSAIGAESRLPRAPACHEGHCEWKGP